MKAATLPPNLFRNHCTVSLFQRILLGLVLVLFNANAFAQITGTVFHDYNGSGTRTTSVPNEPLLAGVVVNVYNTTGTVIASYTTTSASAPNYTIPAIGGNYNGTPGSNTGSVAAGTAVRVEFTGVAAGSFPAPNGTDNATAVQFVTAGAATTAHFAINAPAFYSQPAPRLVTTCFVEGWASPNADVLVSVAYTPSGTQDVTYPNHSHEGVNGDLGAIYGLGYHRQSNTLFSGSYLKRHTKFGSATSTGAIYKVTNPTDNSTTGVSLFLDLNALFGSNVAGANPHPDGTDYFSDDASYPLVGKVSIGDMDISEDGRHLWLVNLSDRKLYKIPLGNDPSNPVPPTLASEVATYPLYNLVDCDGDGSNDLESDVDARPFGLGIRGGKVYVGLICSAESTQTDFTKLRAKVFEFDPATAVSTQVLDFPLNYNRGLGYSGAVAFPNGVPAGSGYTAANPANWRPWRNTYTAAATFDWSWYDSAFREGGYPQPILADIEFADNGDMILGLRDRFGDMVGDGMKEPGGTTLLESDGTGDILRATPNGSLWTLSTAEATDGTEFFAQDNLGSQHQETSMGGLAVLRGYNLIYTVMDPVTNLSAGFDWLHPTNGTLERSYQVYRRPSGEAGSSTLFAKANGLGDLELISDPAPIQIGNRVWADTNGNGVQDAGEAALAGVTVTLKNSGGTQISSAVTDGSGNYYFSSGAGTDTLSSKFGISGLTASTSGFTLSIAAADAALGGRVATIARNDASANGTERDSDGTLNGTNVTTTFATGVTGFNDFSFDFGFTLPVSVGDYAWLDSNGNGIQDGTESGLAGVTVTLFNAAGTTQITTNALGAAISPITTTGSGAYSFTNLPPGQYTVKFTAPSGYFPTITGAGTTVTDSNGLRAQSAVLTAGQSDLTLDSGFVQPVSVGDFIWLDTNANGIQNGGEPGVAGAVATLYNAANTAQVTTDIAGNAINPITTTSTGAYLFNNLPPGQYTVRFTAPAGYVATLVSASGSTSANDSNGATAQSAVLAGGESDLTLDTGYVPVVSLGNYVWLDTNSNGIQEGTESGLAGVTVTLCDAAGTTPITTDAQGNAIAPFVTTGTGAYSFSNLPPGQYTVKFTAPSGYYPTITGAGTTVTDSNGLSAQSAVLTAGQSDLTLDSGFVEAVAVGNLVYIDLNGDHTYTSGIDLPVQQVTVEAYVDADGNGVPDGATPIGSSETDSKGCYLIDNLAPGKYVIAIPAGEFQSGGQLFGTVSIPGAAGDLAVDDQVDENGIDAAIPAATGIRSSSIELLLGTEPTALSGEIGKDASSDNARDRNVNLTVDFGFKGPLKIAGQVRFDGDRDGLLSDPDSPLSGFTAKLYRDVDKNGVYDSGTDVLLGSRITEVDGRYEFDCLPDGFYVVTNTPPDSVLRNTNDKDHNNDRSIPVVLAGSSSLDNDFLETVDPQGWFYDVETSEIVPGGSVEVPSMPDGGTVTLIKTGADGEYAWITNGVAGTYTMSLFLPPGYMLAPQPEYQPQIGDFDAPAGPGIIYLGSGSTPSGTALNDRTGASNPWYVSFILQGGDQEVRQNNIPLIRNKAITYNGWAAQQGLSGPSALPTANPDGDIYDNLQEFAFCFAPGSGVNPRCPLEVVVDNNGLMNAEVNVVHELVGTTVVLEYISDLALSLANGGGWTPVTTIVPSVSSNGDGTDKLIYANLESIPALANGKGFVRLKVDLASPVTTSRTYAAGWTDRTITDACETYSNPFLECEIFSGTVDSNTDGSLDVTTTIGTSNFASVLVAGRNYYVEVLSGPLEGHRWNLIEGSTVNTIAVGSGTKALTADALAGARVIVLEAKTIGGLFPPALYKAGTTPNNSDKVLIYDANSVAKWGVYFLADLTAGGFGLYWVKQGDNTLANQNGFALDACQGIFIHHRAAAISTTQVGHVRQNALACPLNVGLNLVGSGFPLDQSYVNRAMTWTGTNFNGFVGGLDPVRADNVLFWKGDTTLNAENFTTYWLVNAGFDPYRRWSLQGDNALNSQDLSKVFKATRASFYKSTAGNPNYVIPLGWTP